MNNDEKILKALEALQTGQTRLEKTVNSLQADVKDLKQGQQDLATGLHKLTEDMASSFHETWARMDVETARITRLEEAADLTHRN